MPRHLRTAVSSFLVFALAPASLVSADAYSDAVLADSPTAYWRLGDVGNPVADFSGNGNNGAADAGVMFSQASLLPAFPGNSSISTMGTNRVVVPGFAKGPSVSTEYWIQVNSAPTGFHNIVGDGEAGGDFFLMNYLTGGSRIRPHYSFANAPVSTDSNAVLQTGLPYHVVTTYDNAGGTADIFINGTLDKTIGVTTNVPSNTGNQIFIGRDNRESGGDFNIDEAAIYNSALTAGQVRTHRAIGYAGNDVPASLRQYWNFDESDSGTGTAVPLFGTSNFGTFTGTADRTTGLIGEGAAQFNNMTGDGVNVGTAGYSFTTGISIEALFATTDLDGGLQEIFRKEDGGNRILLSFQDPGNTNNNFGQFVGGTDDNLPGLSLGLNVGGVYGELDIELDGQDGRPLLADLADGDIHHLVATYDAASGQKSVYLDGELLGEVTLTPGDQITSGGGAAAFIGNLSSGSEPFSGVIDEFAIYDAALTPEEVAAHFANVQNGLNFFALPQVVPEPATLFIWAMLGIMGITSCRAVRIRRR